MIRRLLLLGVGLALLGLPASAAANQVIKVTDHYVVFNCKGIATPLGLAEFEGLAERVPDGDPTPVYASVLVWSGEPWTSDLRFSTGLGDGTAVFGPGSISASIPLLADGVAEIDGTLVPTGTLTSESEFRHGNAWYRDSAEDTFLAFSGTLMLPGLDAPVAFGPDGCSAAESVVERFVTDPHAGVRRFAHPGLAYCEAADPEGIEATMWWQLGGDGTLSVSGRASSPDGSSIEMFGGGLPGADGSVTFDLIQFDLRTFEELPPGSASVTVGDSGQRLNYIYRAGSLFSKYRGTVLDIGGRLSTGLGTLDLVACQLATEEVITVAASSNGPRPGGRVPAHDLPAGAIPLQPGARDTVATKGARQPGEASYVCDWDFGSVTWEPQHTVWYTVTGTGSPVTIDTAGSDFETLVGVFAGSPDGPMAAGCGDTLVPPGPEGNQAGAWRFDTVPGTTYWVQVGGWEFGFGTLPYGVLKVAVR